MKKIIVLFVFLIFCFAIFQAAEFSIAKEDVSLEKVFRHNKQQNREISVNKKSKSQVAITAIVER